MNDVIVRYNYEKDFRQGQSNLRRGPSSSKHSRTMRKYERTGIPTRRKRERLFVTGFIRRPGETKFSETDFVYEEDDHVYIL